MPTPKTQKQKPDAAATLKKLEAKDPGLKKLLQKAYGYAVFPSVGKASLVLGGSYGRGEVFERGKRIGYATISQMTIGVQLGGTTFSEVIVFESKEALDRFKQGKTSPAAVASAVLVKAGAAANSDFEKGAAVFVYSEGGMELEAAIGGQRFKFKPAGEQGASGKKQQQEGEEESESGEEEDEEGAQASGEDEGEEEEEGEEGEETEDQGEESGGGGAMELAGRAVGGLRSAASKAKAMVKRHPVAATMAGVGVAAGLGLLIARAFKGAGAAAEEGEESDEQDEDENENEGAQDSAEEGEEDEAEDSDSDRAQGQQDEEDEEGGEEDEDEGLSRRLMSRGRSRP